MAEAKNDLIYEAVLDLQGRMSRLTATQSEIRTELQAITGHMLAIETDVSHIPAILARQDLRLGRIERRLGLVDDTAA